MRHIIWICVLSLLIASPLRAAEEPDNVAADVTDAAQSCRDGGGRPNTDAMLSVDDLNGDGGEDWVVDYKKLQCAGTPNPFCGSGGCSLEIFMWSGGSTWIKAFDDTVQSYSFATVRGQKVLKVNVGGSACGKSNSQSCAQTYRFQGNRLVQQ